MSSLDEAVNVMLARLGSEWAEGSPERPEIDRHVDLASAYVGGLDLGLQFAVLYPDEAKRVIEILHGALDLDEDDRRINRMDIARLVAIVRAVEAAKQRQRDGVN